MRVRELIIFALVAALAIAVPALAGLDSPRKPSAASPAKAVKKAKKALKLAKQNRKAIASIALTPGPPGEQGQQGPSGSQGAQGPSGEPATRLFAFVKSDGTLVDGSGATSATRSNEGLYVVRFNRNLESCVAIAEVGESATVGDGLVLPNAPTTNTVIGSSGNDSVTVSIKRGDLNAFADSGFFVAVFC